MRECRTSGSVVQRTGGLVKEKKKQEQRERETIQPQKPQTQKKPFNPRNSAKTPIQRNKKTKNPSSRETRKWKNPRKMDKKMKEKRSIFGSAMALLQGSPIFFISFISSKPIQAKCSHKKYD
jgi:hypothetical protein